jgi:hypothetical protein
MRKLVLFLLMLFPFVGIAQPQIFRKPTEFRDTVYILGVIKLPDSNKVGYVLTADAYGYLTLQASGGSGTVLGSGTVGNIPEWTASNTLGNSRLKNSEYTLTYTITGSSQLPRFVIKNANGDSAYIALVTGDKLEFPKTITLGSLATLVGGTHKFSTTDTVVIGVGNAYAKFNSYATTGAASYFYSTSGWAVYGSSFSGVAGFFTTVHGKPLIANFNGVDNFYVDSNFTVFKTPAHFSSLTSDTVMFFGNNENPSANPFMIVTDIDNNYSFITFSSPNSYKIWNFIGELRQNGVRVGTGSGEGGLDTTAVNGLIQGLRDSIAIMAESLAIANTIISDLRDKAIPARLESNSWLWWNKSFNHSRPESLYTGITTLPLVSDSGNLKILYQQGMDSYRTNGITADINGLRLWRTPPANRTTVYGFNPQGLGYDWIDLTSLNIPQVLDITGSNFGVANSITGYINLYNSNDSRHVRIEMISTNNTVTNNETLYVPLVQGRTKDTLETKHNVDSIGNHTILSGIANQLGSSGIKGFSTHTPTGQDLIPIQDETTEGGEMKASTVFDIGAVWGELYAASKNEHLSMLYDKFDSSAIIIGRIRTGLRGNNEDIDTLIIQVADSCNMKLNIFRGGGDTTGIIRDSLLTSNSIIGNNKNLIIITGSGLRDSGYLHYYSWWLFVEGINYKPSDITFQFIWKRR